ncbi:MAG: hypothetical protein JST58_06375 [Bacteroidetes bacterium]|nr:hypothetical protein [Bacteroidota bacterium]
MNKEYDLYQQYKDLLEKAELTPQTEDWAAMEQMLNKELPISNIPKGNLLSKLNFKSFLLFSVLAILISIPILYINSSKNNESKKKMEATFSKNLSTENKSTIKGLALSSKNLLAAENKSERKKTGKSVNDSFGRHATVSGESVDNSKPNNPHNILKFEIKTQSIQSKIDNKANAISKKNQEKSMTLLGELRQKNSTYNSNKRKYETSSNGIAIIKNSSTKLKNGSKDNDGFEEIEPLKAMVPSTAKNIPKTYQIEKPYFNDLLPKNEITGQSVKPRIDLTSNWQNALNKTDSILTVKSHKRKKQKDISDAVQTDGIISDYRNRGNYLEPFSIKKMEWGLQLPAFFPYVNRGNAVIWNTFSPGLYGNFDLNQSFYFGFVAIPFQRISLSQNLYSDTVQFQNISGNYSISSTFYAYEISTFYFRFLGGFRLSSHFSAEIGLGTNFTYQRRIIFQTQNDSTGFYSAGLEIATRSNPAHHYFNTFSASGNLAFYYNLHRWNFGVQYTKGLTSFLKDVSSSALINQFDLSIKFRLIKKAK